MHDWNEYGHMSGMGIWWIVGAALIAVTVWVLLRSSRRRVNGASESPEQVLQRRYAEGEIDQATYQRMKTEIEN